MNLFRSLYPYALAGFNGGLGWLLYQSQEPFFGLLLATTGVLVLTAVVCETVTEFVPLAGTEG